VPAATRPRDISTRNGRRVCPELELNTTPWRSHRPDDSLTALL
jgi:hypothetical protein